MAERTDPHPELPATLLVQLQQAQTLVAAGQARQAVAELEALRTQLHALDPALGALGGSQLAEALVAAGQRARAVQVLGEDAAKVRAPELADIRARLLLQASPLHPDAEFGLQLAAEADRLAATLDDPQPRVHTIENLLQLLDREGLRQGVREVADGLAVQAHRAGDRPAEVRGMLRVALCDKDDGELRRALDQARDAHACAALLEDHDQALLAEAAALHGQLARENGHLLEAVEALDQALLAQTPPDDATRLQRALAALGLGLDPPRATAELSHLTASQDPAIADRALRALALHLVDLGELDTAAGLLPQMAPPSRPAVQAKLLVAQGRPAEAQRVLAELAAAAPSDVGLQIALAEAERRAGRPLEALERVETALRLACDLSDDHAELRLRLARGPLVGELGDWQGSRQDARRAAELAESMHLPLHHVRARTHIAHALARLDLPDDALAELDRAAAMAAQVGADGAAVQAALCAALLDSLPTQAGLANRPIDVLAALDRVATGAVPGVALLALARRAAETDGDLDTAQALLHHAERADTQGRIAGPIAAIRAQWARTGSMP